MINDRFNSVKNVEKYVRAETGKNVYVTRTEKYLSLSYVRDGEIDVIRIEIPASVLYCLTEKDLASAIEKIKDSTSKTYKEPEKSCDFPGEN